MWSKQARKALNIKINFKESLQQIYEGDKMSKKESYLLTKEYSYQGSKKSFSSKSSKNE